MRLKRHYVHDATGEPGAEGRTPLVLDDRGKPKLDYIEVQHTGTHARQHFSVDLVAAALVEGWMSIKDGKLTLHGKPEALVYTIRRTPGKYRIPTQRDTDPGYEVIHYYECVLDAKQHAKYCAQTDVQRKEDLYRAAGLTPTRKGVARG